MTQLHLLCVLLVALLRHEVRADREVIQPGGDYSLTCGLPVPDDEERFITQFYKDKFAINIFGGMFSYDGFDIISNRTTVSEAIVNRTDRYVVAKVDGHYRLTINNVVPSDSYYYGCQVIDLNTTTVTQYQNSTELLVPGPLIDLFWTFSGEEIQDGEHILDGPVSEKKLACVVKMTNVQPMFNITIGHIEDPTGVDNTKDFRFTTSINGARQPEGMYVDATSNAIRDKPYEKRSLRDVYCRASLYNVTIEKSVNIQVRSRPETGPCTPSNMSAVVGSKNVNLTCLIEAHPTVADVVWTAPDGTPIDASSNHTNCTVSNETVFEGLYTTLTISEVTAEDMFGRYQINATNTEGRGTLHVDLLDENAPTPTPSPTVTPSPSTSPGGAGFVGPSLSCIMMVAIGLVF